MFWLWVLGYLGAALIVIAIGRAIAAQWGKEEGDRLRDRADARAVGTMRDVFSGADIVTHDARDPRNASPHVAVREALRHGYELVHDDAGMLTFRRRG